MSAVKRAGSDRRNPRLRRLTVSLAAALVALSAAVAARAEIITSRDNEGRTITFDVRAAATDVEWYAGVLRGAVHGDEISTVTIRIVAEGEIGSLCGDDAVACYGRRAGTWTIVVPAGRSQRLAQVVLHEYGHHLDRAWPVAGVREPNGTAGWFAARRIQELLSSRLVAFDYSLGWSRSVGEIFAEDYAFSHLSGPLPYAIRWLAPPDNALSSALLAELRAGTPTSPPPSAPPPAPPLPPPTPEVSEIARRGTLAPRGQRNVAFSVDALDTAITLTATVGAANRAGTRARVELFCDGQRLARATFARGQAVRTLSASQPGSAGCRARLTSTSARPLTYNLRLRLVAEPEARQS